MPALKLPKQDEFGNYWLKDANTGSRGAVMPSKRLIGGLVEYRGGWIALVDSGIGFVFEGEQLVRFDSPGAALEEIERQLKRRVVSGAY